MIFLKEDCMILKVARQNNKYHVLLIKFGARVHKSVTYHENNEDLF